MIARTSKGPWKFAWYECGKQYVLLSAERRAEYVCIVPFDDVTHESSIENYANMTLIENAPDMFDLLEKIVDSRKDAAKLSRLITKAKALLVKASYSYDAEEGQA